MTVPTARPPRGHTIVVGADGLSVRVVEELLRTGEPVVVVASAEGREARAARAAGATVVVGDPTDGEVLDGARIADAAAFVITGGDDVESLHAALAARERRPGIHLILRSFDAELGDRLSALLPPGGQVEVLSVSAIAAPAIASAALAADRDRRLDLADRRVRLAGPDAPRDTGVELTLGSSLVPGPRLLDEGPVSRSTPRPLRPGRRWEGVLAAARALAADRRLRWLLGACLVLVAAATATFAVAKDLGVVEALYFTVATVTTTGFGDINLLKDPGWLKVVGILLMLVGALAVATLVALLADAVIAVRLSRIAGGPPPRRVRGHVILCGLGTVGYRVLQELLRAGAREVIVIERDDGAPFIAAARALGVHVMIGDAGRAETLDGAFVRDAACLVIASSDDATNLKVALVARGRSPRIRVVLRLFDPQLAERIGPAVGIHRSYSVSALAAPTFAAAALGRRVVGAFTWRGERIVLAEVVVAAGAPLLGRPSDALERELRFDIVSRRRGGEWDWSPGPAPLVPGETVAVAARAEDVARIAAAIGEPGS